MALSAPGEQEEDRDASATMMAEGWWTADDLNWLQEKAELCGFSVAGVAPVDGVTDREMEDAQRFEAWIDAGFAGEMEYLKRRDEAGRLLRSAVRVAIPWARSVVVCSLNYRSPGPLSIDPAAAGQAWIGRYAWSGREGTQPATHLGESRESASERMAANVPTNHTTPQLEATDYHDVLLERLRLLEAKIQARKGGQSRCYVDTGPMVERAVAARAGIGWIGKNTTVIHQQIGSWTLLASIITDIPVGPGGTAAFAEDRCGTCTRCLDACPTDALVAPRQMDARRCIAYLTIELKGAIPPELREGMGRQVFGCDICQDVCPWNRRAPIVVDAAMLPRQELINPDLEWLASLTPAAFRASFRGSPLERTGLKRLRRSVAIAMGNSGEPRFRSRLESWVREGEPILAELALWALERLG